MSRTIHKYQRIFYLCFCLVFLVVSLVNAVQANEKRQLLRVGYVYEPHYATKDTAGEHKGYVPELVYNVAMRGNFDVQFVDFPNYVAEDLALAEGKIDVEITVPPSEELKKKFIFSDSITTTASYSILVRQNDDRYNFGDMAAVNAMTVGAVTNDAVYNVFVEWCDKNALKPSFKFYPDAASVFQAVRNKEIDSTFVSGEKADGLRLLLSFGQLDCYAMFNPNNKELRQRFDSALKQILTENPLFEQELYNQYVAPKTGNMGIFTRNEREYLATHKTVKVAVPQFAPPHIYKNPDGKLAGIIPSYYAGLGKLTGLNFELVPFPATTNLLKQAVLNGDADVLGYYNGSLPNALKQGFRVISIIDSISMVEIVRRDVDHVKNVAILGGDITLLQEIVAGKDYNTKKFPNVNACYAALSSAEVDAIICSDVTATWIANNHRMDGYITKPLDVHGKLYMAVRASDDALYGILSKGATIEKRNFNYIVANHVLPQSDFRSLMERLPMWGLVTFALIMLALVILLIAFLFTLRRHYREKEMLDAREMNNEREKVRLEAMEKNAEEKNQFFANISHDLRTPLNAIIGFSDLALKSTDAVNNKRYMEKINASGKLMLDLVNDTLTLSKINSGKLALQLEPSSTDKQLLFGTIWEDIKTMALAKNIAFTVSTQEAVHRVALLDKLKLQKIMLNLLTNAVKYTPAGGHINVRFWNERAADGVMESLFSVQDDGIGINKEFQNKVFEPFSQEQRSGYESSGTGLGLAIVKQLVELMGGTIRLDSEMNKGSTFTVRLRLQDAPKGAGQAAGVSADGLAQVDLRGKKILVCEDNALNREIACVLLRSKGIIVSTAENGRLGVDAFAASYEGEFDAILMDLRMPEMDGLMATQKIRSLERFDAKRIPIIAMTADVFAEDIKKCLAVGMNDHVAKPVKPKVLFQTLAKYLA